MSLFHRHKNNLDVQSNRYGIDLIAKDYPDSIIAEQFRTVQTNLLFSKANGKLRSIVITSGDPSEGKSTVSANLAITWAKTGKRVCLVDCDMRRATVHKTFSLNNQQGLSTYLAMNSNLDEVVNPTSVKNLYVITSGPTPPNPSELVTSSQMDNLLQVLYSYFDLVIMDCPPVNSISDASILSAKADGVVIVVPQGVALKSSVKAEVDQLNKVHARILGVVMNHVVKHKMDTNGYYYYYYYK